MSKIFRKDVFIFIIGIALVCYPIISNFVASKDNASLISTYDKQVDNLSSAEKKEMIKDAEQWNDKLYRQQKGISVDDSLDYLDILNIGNGIIGSIEIPQIDVNLPIYHGTNDDVLNIGTGHVEDSSMPVGGINTHTVITGHRGLPSSKLFTRLDELKKGDLFFIKIIDKTLAYKINKIEVVLPDKVSYSIIDNQDLATLITCTPYGLNTHRLVITGKRVPYEEKEKKSIKSSMPSLREIIFYVIPVLFSVAGILFFRKRGVKNV